MSFDYSGLPTSICPNCNSNWIITAVMLDPNTYEIGGWKLDGARCISCDSIITLACPSDNPENYRY
jgi:hypothetical protein